MQQQTVSACNPMYVPHLITVPKPIVTIHCTPLYDRKLNRYCSAQFTCIIVNNSGSFNISAKLGPNMGTSANKKEINN